MAISIQIPADIAYINRKWSKEFSKDYGAMAKATGSVRYGFLAACEKHGFALGDIFEEELLNWREAEEQGLNLKPPEMLTSVFQVKMFLGSQGFKWIEADPGVST